MLSRLCIKYTLDAAASSTGSMLTQRFIVLFRAADLRKLFPEIKRRKINIETTVLRAVLGENVRQSTY